MRAARLLQMLLILQNRGRQSCAALAKALEVTRRTVLRDVDALTEAGLPIIVHRGNQGGVELGFGYRTKLTGLDPDEAAAMGFLLTLPPRDLVDLGLAPAAIRAQAKLREAFPDQTRAYMARAQTLFRIAPAVLPAKDPRRNALALAVREARIVHLKSRSRDPIAVHPVAVLILPEGWAVQDQITNRLWPEADWGDINISAKRFTSAAPKAGKP